MNELVVLVPVLGRPHRVRPFYENLEAATSTPHTVLFICSPDDFDQIQAILELGDSVTHLVRDEPAGHADFAKKINLGYRMSEEPWVFQGADDLSFRPGWDTEAIRVGNQRGVGVVGTNDLANPDVIRGKHATHLLFRRSYIEQHGGTFDNTGDVFSEVYDHQFVDNEFVDLAKRRRQWAFAANSIVEHMHPHWGKAESDATYEKATRETAEDRLKYMERRRMTDPRFARLNARRGRQR